MTAVASPTVRSPGRALALAGSGIGVVIMVAALVVGGAGNGLSAPHRVPQLINDAFLIGGPFMTGVLATSLRSARVSAGAWIGLGAAGIATAALAFGLATILLPAPAALLLAAGFVAGAAGGWSPAALITPIAASAVSWWSFWALAEPACWLLRNGEWIKAPYSRTIVGTGVCGEALRTPEQAAITTAAWMAAGLVLFLLARREATAHRVES